VVGEGRKRQKLVLFDSARLASLAQGKLSAPLARDRSRPAAALGSVFGLRIWADSRGKCGPLICSKLVCVCLERLIVLVFLVAFCALFWDLLRLRHRFISR
jgi:hypothetical protein